MRSKGGNHQSKFMRIVTSPVNFLIKARDLYVRSMTSCASSVAFNGAAGCPAAGRHNLPRSLSLSSVASSSSGDNEDFRELVRAASARSLARSIEVDLAAAQQRRRSEGIVPRSCSVGMGRIDENAECDEFEDGDGRGENLVGDFNRKKKTMKSSSVFPRSRSYAVPNRAAVF